ncbi:hypothetical protein Pogu_1169 [Pyrobaculum oguniense TE7]|uniref:DUF86 domain-containing protein n=1 Tax=Pyrobaculum oguniense (strain DSM 13380 / JCM 10595 / TE7) TaxID=698757 RepID=H6QA74_PYROT|nr:hypothetical protein Pogu_1169 [Pyrobaculum oguniense TE7]
MLLAKLLEIVAAHVELLDEAARRGVDWGDTLSLYAVLHALQVHAQAVIDYLLRTCSLLGASVETPLACVQALQQRGLLEGGEAEMLRRLIRFRNIVVHQYGSIDVERVKRVLEGRGYRDAALVVRRIHERLREKGVEDP